jgi:hypothetical protein
MRKDIVKRGANKVMRKTDKSEVEILEPMQKMTPFVSFPISGHRFKSKKRKQRLCDDISNGYLLTAKP